MEEMNQLSDTIDSVQPQQQQESQSDATTPSTSGTSIDSNEVSPLAAPSNATSSEYSFLPFLHRSGRIIIDPVDATTLVSSTTNDLPQTSGMHVSNENTATSTISRKKAPKCLAHSIMQSSTPSPPPQITNIRFQPMSAASLANDRRKKKNGLYLTREQMLEAREMFIQATLLTKLEKVQILAFMAGAKDNSYPHLGNIVSIKLHETKEKIKQPDNTFQEMSVETHFLMNYITGEYKRVKVLCCKGDSSETETSIATVAAETSTGATVAAETSSAPLPPVPPLPRA